ncbi:MAG: hypothetical protein GKC04_06995 [Methanomicrobiales archaeon]|nr:hypothetical protein [Methanomicrobiales archaeon]
MKKIACVFLLCCVLIGSASAYLINCECPTEVAVGAPIEITGTSNIPAGVSFEIILYKARPSVREIERKTFTIQDGGAWSVTFQTTGLEKGEYNLQIPEKLAYPFGSAADTTVEKPKVIQIIDRSTELTISSPMVQNYDGELEIAGKGSLLGDRGVQITVTAPSGSIVYGPTYIQTDANGAFSAAVPVTASGTYKVRFADATGYISTFDFTIRGTAETTPTATATPSGPVLTTWATASRDAPAYFAVDTKAGSVTIATSTGIDWIIEVRDEDGVIIRKNDQGSLNPETVTLTARGGTVYAKVYPSSSTDSGTVTISVQNADGVAVNTAAEAGFEEGTTPAATQASPLFAAVFCAAALLLVARIRR